MALVYLVSVLSTYETDIGRHGRERADPGAFAFILRSRRTTKKRTHRPATRQSKRKLRPTTPVAARGISPRKRSEPPRQPEPIIYGDAQVSTEVACARLY
jgi:hypothetical protein